MSKSKQPALQQTQPSLKACLTKQRLTRAKPIDAEHLEGEAADEVEDTVHYEDGDSKDDSVRDDDGCSTVADSENAATLVEFEEAVEAMEAEIAATREAGQAAGAGGAPGPERVAESAEAVEAARRRRSPEPHAT